MLATPTHCLESAHAAYAAHYVIPCPASLGIVDHMTVAWILCGIRITIFQDYIGLIEV